MSGLIIPGKIPDDRTEKQPLRWQCPNMACMESSISGRFTFESDEPKCPKCGITAPHIKLLALVHMLVPAEKGPIVGKHGKRFAIACEPQRAYTATHTNQEAATGLLAACNCPGCLKAVGNKLKDSGSAIQ